MQRDRFVESTTRLRPQLRCQQDLALCFCNRRFQSGLCGRTGRHTRASKFFLHGRSRYLVMAARRHTPRQSDDFVRMHLAQHVTENVAHLLQVLRRMRCCQEAGETFLQV